MENNIDQQQTQPLSKKQRRRLAKMQEKQAQQAGRNNRRVGGRILFWVITLAVIGFFVFLVAQLATSKPDDGDPTQTDIAITASDHVKGLAGSAVELIEYSDFQCPACGAFYPIVSQIVDEYSDRIVFAYRHFPLPQHQHAKAMAYAAEAAAKQGTFWEMHDLIFENQNAWSPLLSVSKTIMDYATRLKLNLDQFEADLKSTEVRDFVDAQYSSGVANGVNGTPSFFVNGVKITTPRSLEAFKVVLDQALTTSNEPATSTPSPAPTL